VGHRRRYKVPQPFPTRSATSRAELADAEDAELVARARDRGDTAALEELVRRHRDTAYRVALRICLDASEAEDIAQEGLVRAWRSLQRFRGDAAFSTWLYRIVTNLALNAISRRREQPTSELPEPPGPDLDPAGRVADRERLTVALAALADLTAEQRACYVLREVEGLGYAEIGAVLGLSLAAVKGRLFRARAELAAALLRYDRSGEEDA
jgi:RNA polymerase sigma-70 factor, ECF subfamily